MLFYSLRLLSRLPLYALGRQKILPGLKANFCCPALQFHRSYWQCKGNKNSWANQKYRGLDLHFWAPNFAFLHYHYNYRYYSYKMPKIQRKKSIFIYNKNFVSLKNSEKNNCNNCNCNGYIRDIHTDSVDYHCWLSWRYSWKSCRINLVISNIKHYELSIEKVLKSCSPCKKWK